MTEGDEPQCVVEVNGRAGAPVSQFEAGMVGVVALMNDYPCYEYDLEDVHDAWTSSEKSGFAMAIPGMPDLSAVQPASVEPGWKDLVWQHGDPEWVTP